VEILLADFTQGRSRGGTTEEMMMLVTWLGASPFISKSLTKKTPYSSTV